MQEPPSPYPGGEGPDGWIAAIGGLLFVGFLIACAVLFLMALVRAIF
ncbi:MAG: hypothetical protein DHS20C14_10300 [Phycisphaeraceae bacterium]|nr:MAG: hypothetical protein DHS20C14_10300 [Phycisphaeraceae bacterium]